MCEHCQYNEFPVRSVGGPSGNYFLTSDVVSSEWVEFRVVAIATGDTSPCSFLISGLETLTGLSAVTWVGAVTNNDNASLNGLVIRLGATTTLDSPTPWFRVANQQKQVHIRMDLPAATSAYVGIQFRDKILNKIPAPAKTVPIELEQELHQEREKRILAAFGKEAELEIYARKPTVKGIRKLTTGHDY